MLQRFNTVAVRAVVVLVVSLSVLCAWLDLSSNLCLTPSNTIMYFQLHRLFLYSLVHGTVGHALFGLVVLLWLLPPLEKEWGSIRMIYMLLLGSAGNGLIYSLGSAITSLFFESSGFWSTCVTGSTCTVLMIAVLYAYTPSISKQLSVGSLRLPPTVVPLGVLLISFALPNSIIWLDLIGVCTALGMVQGILDPLQLSPSAAAAFERSPNLRWLVSSTGFVACPDKHLPVSKQDIQRTITVNPTAVLPASQRAPLQPQPGSLLEPTPLSTPVGASYVAASTSHTTTAVNPPTTS
eukprot:m.140042 g.140042  ORF g.140042 m.140042 type:complete len:294 (-) comp14030_c0_seq1:4886-5767(-)